MPKGHKTDLQVLRALLSMPLGGLTASEKHAFQAMWDQVASGNQIRLSMKQRQWADQVYDKHKLDNERAPVKNPPILDKSLIANIDKLPRPLKPPGRK